MKESKIENQNINDHQPKNKRWIYFTIAAIFIGLHILLGIFQNTLIPDQILSILRNPMGDMTPRGAMFISIPMFIVCSLVAWLNYPDSGNAKT